MSDERWTAVISRRVLERDRRRRIQADHVRGAILGLVGGVPLRLPIIPVARLVSRRVTIRSASPDIGGPARPGFMDRAPGQDSRVLQDAEPLSGVALEYLQRLLGSLIFFWVAGRLVAHFTGASPVYPFAGLGGLFSANAVYLKYRLSADPGFRIRECACADRHHLDTTKVLKSRESAFFGIPSAAFGVILYALLPALQYFQSTDAEIAAAAVACCGSAYLGYVMVARIRGLCATCINVGALNALILIQVWLGL
jgi:uncharacterized membrane protein